MKRLPIIPRELFYGEVDYLMQFKLIIPCKVQKCNEYIIDPGDDLSLTELVIILWENCINNKNLFAK
jgi:hypothetical protein